MKIIKFRQEELCCMWKDSRVKMDRADVWGAPHENGDSLLTHIQGFLDGGGDDNAHVVHMFGQGGVGKSFVCREIAGILSKDPYREKLYVVSVDLQRQKGVEDTLKSLADEIAAQVGKKELFPRFQMAYYAYKMKAGEKVQQEERSTKWESMHENASFNLVAGAAGLLTSFGTVSDVIDLANEGYKWFLKMRDNAQYKGLARQIEAMGEEELKGQLTRYFAADFCKYMEEKNKTGKKFAILLDTVESMRYQVLRSGKDEDYLEWLAGSGGLFRLLPDCLWMLFGREEIAWESYDREWESSFLSVELGRHKDPAVKEYLMRQLGQDVPGEGLDAVAGEIVRQAEGYSLAIENCVDVYFKIWNENMRKNRITDRGQAGKSRPSLLSIKELFLDDRGRRAISSRFLQYYTLQEREVLYTLICLGTWTEEILESLIWKGAPNNILVYGEMCGTSFIGEGESGQRFVQGLMLDVIMEECPQRLKRNLLTHILNRMGEGGIDETYWLLCNSAVRIAKFCSCGKKEWELLGEEFAKAVSYLAMQAGFYDLLQIARGLGEASRGRDEELYSATLIVSYFSLVFRKQDGEEELRLLQGREAFGKYSVRVWKAMVETAREVGACAQAYEVTSLLAEKASGEEAEWNRYLICRTRAELMQELGDRFGPVQIEEELGHICAIADNMSAGTPGAAQKINARLWAEYYFYCRRDLADELAARKIRECIGSYRSWLTEEEAENDVGLCVLEIMQIRVKKSFVLAEVNRQVFKGLRILEREFGRDAMDRSDASFLIQTMVPEEDMPEENREILGRFFADYYRSFYLEGRWGAYPALSRICGLLGWFNRGDGATGAEEISGVVRQGILYLSNLTAGNPQNILRRLLCGRLLGRLTGSVFLLEKEENLDGPQLIRNQILNNRLLLHFLQKAVEVPCKGQEDLAGRRLEALLGCIFADSGFDSSAFSTEDKRLLLGFLELCGMQTGRADWKAEFTGSASGDEFDILGDIHGWQWKIDQQADIWTANAVLHLAWALRDEAESAEERILEGLEKRFRDAEERDLFWSGMREEAALSGEEWERHISRLAESAGTDPRRTTAAESRTESVSGDSADTSGETFEDKIRENLRVGDYDAARSMIKEEFAFFERKKAEGWWTIRTEFCVAHMYVPVVKNSGMDGYLEEIQQLKKGFLGGEYFVLRACAYADDRESFAAHYREKKLEIWKDLEKSLVWNEEKELYQMLQYVNSLGDRELSEDYCGRLADLYAESRPGDGYTRGILYHLGQLTECVPFAAVWRRERCIEEINSANYREIDRLLTGYLPPEDRLELFTVGVWGKRKSGGVKRPLETELSFFGSRYFLWLQERFGEECEEMLRKELPQLYAAREEYEGSHKDAYLWQTSRAVREVETMISRLQESDI